MKWFAVCVALAFLFLIAGCASRPPRAFSLTVSTEPEAGLRVKIDQNTYTSPCQLNVEKGQHVVEILSPQLKDISPDVSDEDVRYVFSNWDDKNTSNPRTLTIQNDVSYKALVTVEYKIEVIVQGSGSVSLATDYYYESQVTISATPDAGWKFSKWSVDGQDVQGNPLLLNIDSPKKIICYFQVDTNNNPSIPNTPTPEDGAVNTPLSVVLTWNCSDPDGDNLVYDVYFGQDPNPGLVSSDQANASYSVSSLSYSTTYYWKITAKDGNGGETEGPVWSFTTKSNSAPVVDLSVSPLQTYVGQTVFATITATDPDGDTLEGTIDWMDGTTENLDLTSGQDTVEHVFNAPGNYSVTVSVTDGFLTTTKTHTVDIVQTPNNAPLVPNTPTPEDGAVNTPLSVVLTWSCSDPDGDNLVYDVYFGQGPNPGLVSSDQANASYLVSGLECGDLYYWKVVAIDSHGAETSSPVWNFSTTRSPSVPSMPMPSNGEVNVPLDITLNWNCSDPDGDNLVYDVYFGQDPNPGLVSSDQANASYSVSSLSYSTTYYWKITAKDGNGGETEGPVWSFATKTDPISLEPNDPNPNDGAADVPIDTDISWNCLEQQGIVFDVYFGESPNPPLLEENYPSKIYDLPMLEYSTTYYWKIIAKDGLGGSFTSSVWSFTTVENLPPAVPYDPQPENNAVGVSLNVPLSWSCYDPDGDPISYDVYFDTSPDPALRQQNITGNYYRFIIDPVGEGRTYYWKIVAKDDHGNETEGPVWNFTVTHNPEQPSNPNPTDASSVDGSNVILSWDCFDNDGDELVYDVHFGIESDPPRIALGHTSNTYDLEPLDPGATYYWRITARDGKGGITEGPIWSFETH